MSSNKSARTSISRNSKELPLTPVSLAKCPTDILLDIIGHLDLHDTFSFLSVCSGVKRLRHSRFLWLDLLQRTERVRPLAFPVGTDITHLSLAELEAVAQHTHHVQQNWGSERPSIRRPVRSKSYGPAGSGVAAILSVVPGTSLAILYIRETTQLICCDLDAPHLMESMVVGHISRKAHYNKPGLHLIALTMGHHTHARSLCVLGVEHENGRAVTLKEYFRAPSYTSCKALFICEDVIGVIPYPEDETFIRVHATNFLTNVSVTVLIEVGHPISNFSYLLCYVHDTSPYIVVANSWEFEVHRCPADRLPLGGAHGLESGSHERINNTRVAKIDVEQDGLRADHGVYDSEIAEMRWSPMGFHAIVVEYSHETAYPTTFAHFWPSGIEKAPTTICSKEGSGPTSKAVTPHGFWHHPRPACTQSSSSIGHMIPHTTQILSPLFSYTWCNSSSTLTPSKPASSSFHLTYACMRYTLLPSMSVAVLYTSPREGVFICYPVCLIIVAFCPLHGWR
ncbi:hypothetical protein BD779DRAFT_537079 [Infundibulicybe gibba]|nr:hypothetical protein BD779DRAFT_537079 [Infundibulicybe gibba]